MCRKLTFHLLFILTVLMMVVGGALIIIGGVTAWSPIYVKLSVQTNSWKPDVSLESQRESYERIAQLFQSVTRPLGIVFMVFGFILLISAVIGLFGICQFPVMTFVLNCCGYWNGDDFNANGTQFTRRDRYLDYEYP
ncbi:hypothetical protein X801_08874, partial [Opisthorchis viverrini]